VRQRSGTFKALGMAKWGFRFKIYKSNVDTKKHAAVTSLVDMLEASMIDEEAARQVLKNVMG